MYIFDHATEKKIHCSIDSYFQPSLLNSHDSGVQVISVIHICVHRNRWIGQLVRCVGGSVRLSIPYSVPEESRTLHELLDIIFLHFFILDRQFAIKISEKKKFSNFFF